MNDLSVLFLTNNKVPRQWADYHNRILLKAIGDSELITISRKPMNFGINLIQTERESSHNIYWQMLRGAKVATRDFIAIAEDDTLYPADHFEFRPDKFAYNDHRWALYTYGEPTYSLKNFIRTNAVLICPRKLMVEALEERFAKYPVSSITMPAGMCAELGVSEKDLGITPQKLISWKSKNPVVQFDHDFYTGDTSDRGLHRRHSKAMGVIQCYDIPLWGKSSELVKEFK